VRPRTDIFETPDAWLLVVDLPGTDENRIDIAVEKHVLTIKADPEDVHPEGFDPVHTEFLSRRFERSFRLPEWIDIARIDANVKNGVLRLTVPKSSEARPRQVAVKAG
jgi:HSP20 family molecular chaperone IbpA